MVISHVIAGTNLNIYRASILDITDPSYFKQFTEFYEGSIRNNSTNLDFVFDDFQFRLMDADRLGPVTTSSEHGDVLFNITFELSSSAMLLNAGTGTFQWGQYLARVTQAATQLNDANTTQDKTGPTQIAMNGPYLQLEQLDLCRKITRQSKSTQRIL